MTAKGAVAYEKPVLLRTAFVSSFRRLTGICVSCNHAKQFVKRQVVANAPLGRVLLFKREVIHADECLPAGRDKVAAHVGKIDVAAIEVGRGIALLPQRTGNAGHGAALSRHLHDRQRRKGRIAAQGANRATVGSPTVSIATAKADAFFLQLLQAGHGCGKLLAAAFQQDNDDVGPGGGQQRVNSRTLGCVYIFHQPSALVFVEIAVLRHIAHLVSQR